jgi:hypothetical protein
MTRKKSALETEIMIDEYYKKENNLSNYLGSVLYSK